MPTHLKPSQHFSSVNMNPTSNRGPSIAAFGEGGNSVTVHFNPGPIKCLGHGSNSQTKLLPGLPANKWTAISIYSIFLIFLFFESIPHYMYVTNSYELAEQNKWWYMDRNMV